MSSLLGKTSKVFIFKWLLKVCWFRGGTWEHIVLWQNQVPINLMVNLTLTSCGTSRFCLACTASYRGEDILGRANLLISNSIYIITFMGTSSCVVIGGGEWKVHLSSGPYGRPCLPVPQLGPTLEVSTQLCGVWYCFTDIPILCWKLVQILIVCIILIAD